MMDYESLIADLQKISQMNSISHYKRDVCAAAAIALSTIQAENEQLKDQLYDGEGVNLVNYWRQQAKIEENGHKNCQAENEKLRDENRRWIEATKTLSCAIENLRAELEQAKAERDAAVESIPHECKTCVYHTVFFNGCTPDHDCTNPDGGCSNNCDRWKWRGPQKED